MALVAPKKHKIMHIINLDSAIQMEKIDLTKTVKEWSILILQFEENHQKNDNNLFMIKANEIFTFYNDFKNTLAQLQQNFSEKLVEASSIISKAVLKQEASEQKSQMAIYEQLVESIELGPNATLVKDIYNILNVKKLAWT